MDQHGRAPTPESRANQREGPSRRAWANHQQNTDHGLPASYGGRQGPGNQQIQVRKEPAPQLLGWQAHTIANWRASVTMMTADSCLFVSSILCASPVSRHERIEQSSSATRRAAYPAGAVCQRMDVARQYQSRSCAYSISREMAFMRQCCSSM